MPECRRRLVLRLPHLHRKPRAAVLIDAENVPSASVPLAMDVAWKTGRAIVKRAYANAALLQSSAWKGMLSSFGIEPIACFGYVAGKNSSDIRIVVDAMKLLFRQSVDVFVVVSSDSDFVPLAREVHAAGKIFHGVGSDAVSEGFRQTCDEFHVVYSTKRPKANRVKEVDERLIRVTRDCMSILTPEGGWCDVSQLCNQLNKRLHGFSPKEYGCKNMTTFAREIGILEVKRTKRGKRVRLEK